MPTTRTQPTHRELAHRSSNGIDVFLYWRTADDALVVTVTDGGVEEFELAVAPAEALDVFEHPYAYAAFRGAHFAPEALEAAA